MPKSPEFRFTKASAAVFCLLAACILGAQETGILSFRCDDSGKAGIERMASGGSGDAFLPIGGNVSLGYRKGALWFRAAVPPVQAESRRALYLRSTYIGDIKAFILPSAASPSRDARPEVLDYGTVGYRLDFDLPAATGAAVYFRVETDAPVKFDALVLPSGRIDKAARADHVYLGILLGVFWAFFVMALAMCFLDAETPFLIKLSLALYSLFAIFNVIASSGLGWDLLWRGNAFLEKRMTPLCSCAIVFLAIWIVRKALELRKRARALDRVLLAHQALVPLVMAGLLFLDFRTVMEIGGILVLTSMASILAACAYGTIRRWRQAYFVLPAFAAFTLGSATAQGITFGAFAALQRARPEYLGFAVQLFLLSLAYCDRLGVLRSEKLQSARLGRVVLAEPDRQKAKTGFFSALSHEIKNPIALIGASLDAVYRGEYGASVPSDHRAFSLMRKNLHRLERLVDGALDVIEIEEGKRAAEPEPVDIAASLSLFASEFKSAFHAKGAALEAELGSGILGYVDRRHFEIIAFNLIANALRRSHQGGVVALRLARSGDSRFSLEVSDSGQRIDPKLRESIFDLYGTSFDGGRSGNEDTFIGLCQARQLARLNGGDLELADPGTDGETFRLRLPLSVREPENKDEEDGQPAYRPESPDSGTQSAPAQAKRGSISDAKRILVVEDSPDLLDFLAEALGKDFLVDKAENGMEAMAALNGGSIPDLIVSDVMMPVMDGPALLSRLKEDERFKSIPLIFLTAHNQAEDRIKSVQDGAVAYIGKPFFYEELKAAVDNILEVRESGARDVERRLLKAIHERPAAESRSGRGEGGEAAMEAFGFSRQEREVAIHLATGKSDKEIASILGLSPRTVSNYVGKMLKKADAASRTELAARLAD